jgi:hypothetical protein
MRLQFQKMLNRPKVNADQRRALQLLADAGVQGRTGATLFAYGVRIDMLADLLREGLATARREPTKAGERQIEVARLRITAAGQRALNDG